MSVDALTVAENLVWVGQRMFPESPLYNMALLFELPPDLNPGHFETAFDRVVHDCDSLRMTVVEREGTPVRRIHEYGCSRLQHLDFSLEQDAESAVRKWANDRTKAVFDMAACLYEAALLKIDGRTYRFYLNQHHIITDGLSTAIVVKHLVRCYEAARSGTLDEVAPLPGFENYVRFERDLASTDLVERARQYWADKMADAPAPPLPYGLTASVPTTGSSRIATPLGVARSAALREIAGGEARMLTEDMSLFCIFSTLVTAFIHRISGSSDISIGTPAHNRPTNEFRESAGLFIELFPLRSRLAPDETFATLLRSVQEETIGLLRNAQPGASNINLHAGFNVIVNYITAKFARLNGFRLRSNWIHPDEADANHNLRLQIHDFDEVGSFELFFDFNKGIFDDPLQKLAVDQFFEVVDHFLESRSTRLSEIDLRQPQSPAIGDPPDKIGGTRPLLAYFEDHVRESPQSMAIESGDLKVTYSELSERTDQIAGLLLERGLKTDQPVALRLGRSIDFVVAVLGVMKAGGVFCPIPPESPESRTERILTDLGNPLILSPVDFESSPPANEVPLPDLSGDLAYVLYTSGSTGRPKGVMVGNDALSNYVLWASATYVNNAPARWPLFTSTGFDLTLTSILVPLVSGGTILVYEESEGVTDTAVLDVFSENRVDVVKLTPAHLSSIKHVDLTDSQVQTLIVGGEQFPRSAALRALTDFGRPLAIFNEYGPTEATVGCVVHRFDPQTDNSESVPIGTPIHGARVHVLNDLMHNVPTGGSGLLYLSGVCLAAGYWNDHDLTSDRFFAHPATGERLYSTGDRVRILLDGNLEYLGREDDQIKIRGHRVELAEVQTALSAMPSVADCAVVALTRRVTTTEDLVSRCIRCGLPSNVPGTRIDQDGLCNTCIDFEMFSDTVADYWRSLDDLARVLNENVDYPDRTHDCIVLFSGGKDSTYTLARIAELGLRPLAFTLDNGFISDQAKDNIRRITDELGIDHVFGSTPAMDAIFVDSLERHANVCNGCFKTIYSLSLKIALENRIPYIVTGLSRGQLFETRLSGELFSEVTSDAEMIDLTVLEARKSYHRVDDGVGRLLGADWIDDEALDRVAFVDFFRYCDVELDEMLSYLSDRVPWIRPGDTGRSTNCLINDLGIYVHTQTRGFHNYAYPYSWDVRLGHKNRDDALAELDDDIDESQVNQLMRQIGYKMDDGEVGVVAYVVPKHGQLLDPETALSEILPPYMIPSRFIEVEKLPLTVNGKIDRARLVRALETNESVAEDFVAPMGAAETVICGVWEKVLDRRISTSDNFFEIGGDSIRAIQVVSLLSKQGFSVDTTDVFRYQTVSELATVCYQNPVSTPPDQTVPRIELGERQLDQLSKALSKIRGGK